MVLPSVAEGNASPGPQTRPFHSFPFLCFAFLPCTGPDLEDPPDEEEAHQHEPRVLLEPGERRVEERHGAPVRLSSPSNPAHDLCVFSHKKNELRARFPES